MPSEFNAIEYANELQTAGVDSKQATVHANALTKAFGQFVFSRDLVKLEANLRQAILQSEERLSIRFDALKMALNAPFDAARLASGAQFSGVQSELKLVRWVLGLAIGLEVAIVVKLIVLAAPG